MLVLSAWLCTVTEMSQLLLAIQFECTEATLTGQDLSESRHVSGQQLLVIQRDVQRVVPTREVVLVQLTVT